MNSFQLNFAGCLSCLWPPDSACSGLRDAGLDAGLDAVVVAQIGTTTQLHPLGYQMLGACSLRQIAHLRLNTG